MRETGWEFISEKMALLLQWFLDRMPQRILPEEEDRKQQAE
jgi:hypothetical protein